MPVTYTKEQREQVKDGSLKLVTLAAAGVEFQEAVSEEVETEIIRFILMIRERHRSGRAATVHPAGFAMIYTPKPGTELYPNGLIPPTSPDPA